MEKVNGIVWSSLKSGTLDTKSLDRKQKQEIDIINNTADNLIKDYGHSTNFCSISKTGFGYEMKRRCEIEDCGSIWTIEVYTKRSDGVISCNSMCKHSLPSKKCKFLYI